METGVAGGDTSAGAKDFYNWWARLERPLQEVTLGTIGYAEVTTNQGPFTAITDLTGLAATVTVGSGRRIRITAKVGMSSSVADDQVTLFVTDSANVIQDTTSFTPGAIGRVGVLVADVVLVPGAGTYTYKLRAQRLTGTGNITMNASPTQKANIKIEDIGT